MSKRDRPRRIEIANDTLIIDEDFCRDVLAGATRRTGSRLEAEGLPYIFIAGLKYRPLRECQEWLASRIERRNQPKQAARRGRVS